MVRKIFKSNRHKKLKAVDPFYTGERKLTLDRKLMFANQDPFKNEADEQKLPMKLREINELKSKILEQAQEARRGKIAKKKAKKLVHEVFAHKPDDKGAEVPLRPAPSMNRKENESDKTFIRRIERESELVINRAQYETQFKCKLETQDDKVVIKRDKKMSETKRAKLEKLKDKLKYKKIKNQYEREINDVKFKDTVRFGEIAHHPPAFTAAPKITKKYASQREALEAIKAKPGAKNLLLKEKLNNPQEQQQQHRIQFSNEKSIKTQGDEANKRVCLTIPLKTTNGLTEQDRFAVIQSYRKLKKTGLFN